jgi:hypothetical protein
MRLPDAIAKALAGRGEPLPGHEVAQVAGVAYKAAIDALGRMHDAGTVVRFGRKRGAAWALVGSPAACQPDPMGALEALWRKQGGIPHPHPHGGEAKTVPPSGAT